MRFIPHPPWPVRGPFRGHHAKTQSESHGASNRHWGETQRQPVVGETQRSEGVHPKGHLRRSQKTPRFRVRVTKGTQHRDVLCVQHRDAQWEPRDGAET